MGSSIESFKLSQELTKEIDKLGDCFYLTESRLEGWHDWTNGFSAHNWQLTFAPLPSEFDSFLVRISGRPEEPDEEYFNGFSSEGEKLHIELDSNEWEDNWLMYDGENFNWNQDIEPDEQAIAECLAKIMWVKFQKVKDKVNAEYMKLN